MQKSETGRALGVLFSLLGGWFALHALTFLFYAITNINGAQSHMLESFDLAGTYLFLFGVPAGAVGLLVLFIQGVFGRESMSPLFAGVTWVAVVFAFVGLMFWLCT